MKDSHLTLRLPADLAAALDRRAGERDLGRSQLVREAVRAYLAGAAATSSAHIMRSGRELAERWAALPRLGHDEAAALGDDIVAARRALPAPEDAWK